MDLLIVHIGAGNHSSKLNDKYSKLIKKSLSTVNNETSESTDIIIQTSKILEDSPLTNCGYGSSLNILGQVSNDASILQFNSKQQMFTRFGSLHDITNVNPIYETIDIFNKIDQIYEIEKYKELGMTLPRVLSYSIKSFIYDKLNIELSKDIDCVSTLQLNKYDMYNQGFLNPVINDQDKIEADELLSKDDVQDTIGIIHITPEITTVASSSGGNFLKLPSRIGCAGIIGSGIGFKSNVTHEITCMCSGNGEDIILLNLANLISTQLLQDPNTNIHDFLQSETSKIPLNVQDNNQPIMYLGLIVVIHDLSTATKQLLYYHSTESFYFGYKVNDKIKIVLSRKDKGYVFGEVIFRNSLQDRNK